MKYKKINTLDQYNKYCNIHEELFLLDNEKKQDEIDLLEILIEEYDNRIKKETYQKLNPVELLKSLIIDSSLNQAAVAKKIKISSQLLSDILNYRRNISKEVVEKLSKFFAMSEEAFSRKYDIQKIYYGILREKKSTYGSIGVIKEIEVIKPIGSDPLRTMMDNNEHLNISQSDKIKTDKYNSAYINTKKKLVVKQLTIKNDNLKIIEGIGPKIESLLYAEKITTFKKLSKTKLITIKAILEKSGLHYKIHDPTTWPKQAAIAAKRDWTKSQNKTKPKIKS